MNVLEQKAGEPVRPWCPEVPKGASLGFTNIHIRVEHSSELLKQSEKDSRGGAGGLEVSSCMLGNRFTAGGTGKCSCIKDSSG